VVPIIDGQQIRWFFWRLRIQILERVVMFDALEDTQHRAGLEGQPKPVFHRELQE